MKEVQLVTSLRILNLKGVFIFVKRFWLSMYPHLLFFKGTKCNPFLQELQKLFYC